MSAPGRRRTLLRLLVDLLVPAVLYYVLRSAGMSVYLSLLVTAVVPAAMGAYLLVRERRVDGLSVFMTAMMVLGVGASLISGSERFLLAREGWLTAAVGLWFLASLRAGMPLTFLFSRPLLEHRFPVRGTGEPWDVLWERLPRFRRAWRVTTVLWGAGTLLDSAARVVMAYTLPVDAVPALGSALYAGTSITLMVIANIYFATVGLFDRRSAMYAPLDREGAPAPST
ncbi:VC0807 family protein [Streptosporangium amethystogenes]|uniref:VC0807 family protein n=1 Tax=Streptosporangium amethystogenes TaxID=2002 RepID=UPI000691FA0A|nr:VC0807 family protein [Streptosporangium amethystogenes]